MGSIYLALAIFLVVALWGAFEHNRKFRQEFKKRGKSWEAALALMASTDATLIVDTLWGPQQGLGHPTIWLSLQPLRQSDAFAETVQTDAFLLHCPRALRSPEALRKKFGPTRIVLHTWSIDLSLVQQRT